jgi:hypothetical protein
MHKKLFVFLFLSISCFIIEPIAVSADESNGQVSLIEQLQSQNMTATSSVFGPIAQLLETDNNNIDKSDTYLSLKQFWYNDIFKTFQNGLLQPLNQFFSKVIYEYLPAIITWLCNIVKQFFLNDDLTKIQNNSQNSNDFALLLNRLNATISGIALDISLLLFILSIWRYWVDAAWKGGGNLMSPVARLIFAIGMLLAWPTIYSFQIQLSNELISALFTDPNGNIQFLDPAIASFMASIINPAGIPPTSEAITGFPAFITNNFRPFIENIIPIILCFLFIIFICELIYLIILKAIQMAILTAQYVFAPIFLILLTNPVTDNIATGYIRTFVEVSLWNFIWIGLLKILVILLYSDFNPWGKLLTAIGILQIMMDVPQFLAHAKISVASDFVNPHLLVKKTKDIFNFDERIGVKKEKHSKTSPDNKDNSESSSSFALKEPGLDFQNNNIHSNLAPPTSRNKSTKQPGNQSNSNNPSNSNSSFLGAAAVSAGSLSAKTFSQSSDKTALAISSSNSSANALAIAMASINGSSSHPSSGHSGPDPNKPSPSNPNGPHYPNLPPKPPSDPPLGQNFGPDYPKLPPHSGFNSSTNSARRELEFVILPNKKSNDPLLTLKDNQNQHNDSIFAFSNQERPSNAVCTTDISQKSNHNRENPFITKLNSKDSNLPFNLTNQPPVKVKENFCNPPLDNEGQLASFIGGPSLIFDQLYAFHTGAINYHLKQSKNTSPLMRGVFPAFTKTNDNLNYSSSPYSNNLIFGYGNTPTLMGIPPVYPETNKT